MIDKSTFRRIAVFRALQLGDLIEAVPALRALRSGFPHAEITLIGLPWARIFAQRFHRYLDRFVEFAGFPGIAELEFVPERTARFLDVQRRYGYDLAIQMHGSGKTSNRFVSSLGARMTAGYFEGFDRGGLTLGFPYPDTEPEVYRNLELVRLFDCPDCDPRLEFPLTESDIAEADALLHAMPDMTTTRVAPTIPETGGEASYRRGDPRGRHVPHKPATFPAIRQPLIGLHVGARPPARRWPSSYFATLADELVRSFDARIILTGSIDELPIVHSVEEQMVRRPINLAGKTSLGGLAALIKRLDLFVSNDTGPAHIAYALDTPSITIFGPADYRRWVPLDARLHRVARQPVECSPCGYWECPIDHRCLRRVYPRSVIKAVEDLLVKGTAI